MKHRHTRWFRKFGVIYSIVAVAFTVYVLLDTFVIPRKISTQAAASTTTGTVSTGNASGTAGQGGTIGISGSGSSSGIASSGNNSSDSAASTEASSASATVTDTSYDDGNISISYKTERINDTTCYIVDVQVSSVEYLKAAFANGTYGRNIKETTSDMAEDNGAILAINGDYYGFRNYGYVLRNGVLYRDTGGNDEDLVIDSDGTMRIISEDDVSASELESEGVWQVLSFGPALVNNGEIVVGQNEEVDQSMSSNPRTAIGMISPLHYIIIVSDGRTSSDAGLTLYELAEIFQEEGATVAYNLDGGGSSTLYFNGSVINNPSGGARGSSERAVSDILYLGY